MVASASARVQRRVARRLIAAGAVSPETAQIIDGWSWSESRRLERLIARGFVHRQASGAIYIDEAAWSAFVARQRKLALVLALVLVALLIIGMLLTRFVPAVSSAPSSRITARIAEYDADVRAMDSDAIARLFVEDGEMWNAGTLTERGPDAIRAFLHTFDGKFRVESQQTTIDRIEMSGDLATVSGTYHQTARVLSDNSVVNVTGKIQSIWVPCEESSWCIKRVETTPK